ncbi:hypothetical protein C8R44DRAFT_881987 [Mycena epipterygia]|nr:hypothetical protein C8R44DRAFT_881987 [Mycena epipterygia]
MKAHSDSTPVSPGSASPPSSFFPAAYPSAFTSFGKMNNSSSGKKYKVTKREHQDLANKINGYVQELQCEQDDALREAISTRLEKFLKSIHSSEGSLKNFVYTLHVNADARNEELVDLWARYKDKSKALAYAKQTAAYDHMKATSESAPPMAIPASPNGRTARQRPVNPPSPTRSVFVFPVPLEAGNQKLTVVYSSAAQSIHSRGSANGMFDFQIGSYGHNLAAPSVVSNLYYPMPMGHGHYAANPPPAPASASSGSWHQTPPQAGPSGGPFFYPAQGGPGPYSYSRPPQGGPYPSSAPPGYPYSGPPQGGPGPYPSSAPQGGPYYY